MNYPTFIYLSSFSTNGGIEKFNRAFLKALNENFPSSKAMSLYDKKSDVDERYFPSSQLVDSSFHAIFSVFKMLIKTFFAKANPIIFGHINLAPLALIIKKIKPSSKYILIAHGIDVWNDLNSKQQKMLSIVDEIWAVSSYTKKRLVEDKGVEEGKIKVFHNTIDPFLEKPKHFQKPNYLIKRYAFTEDTPIIFTLCRLSSNEAYKGYDKVVEAMPKVLKEFPNAVYLIGGKYDKAERERLEQIAREKGVLGIVYFTGFLPDQEIIDHYLLADLFVMPSRNEGFGIVFLEAMLCGLPVIAGNADGSVDALKNGELGTLVDPLDVNAIAHAINKLLQNNDPSNKQQKKNLQAKVLENFSFGKYKLRLATLLK